MNAMASQITTITIVYSTVYSGADQRKHQSSASLAFVRGIHRGPVNSPHKWLVMRKMFPFDDVIMAVINFPNCSSKKTYTEYQSWDVLIYISQFICWFLSETLWRRWKDSVLNLWFPLFEVKSGSKMPFSDVYQCDCIHRICTSLAFATKLFK